MDESGHGHVSVFAAGVGHFAGGDDDFAGAGDDLAADGAVGVVRLDEVEVVRGDGEGQFVAGEEEAFAFVRREAQVLRGLLGGADAVAELPAPVVPFGVGGLGPETGVGQRALPGWPGCRML
jgi:hypothetical protein